MPDAMRRPCRVCGNPVALTGKRGRPAVFCSAACRTAHPVPKPPPTLSYSCHNCGAIATSERRGTPPKWCLECRGKEIRETRCKGCREIKPIPSGNYYCSTDCRQKNRRPRANARPTKQLTLPLGQDQRSPLRRAHQNGDHAGVLQAIRRKARVDEATGCWIWQHRESKDGYPLINLGGRSISVHRLALEAKHGAPLGSQAAHHTCAVSMCVNPDHLQPVTHRENSAEMLARRSYQARIAELETALMELQPDHPLLLVIRTA